MSVAEMQACLARLYVDSCFRDLLETAPERALGRYVLTNEELAVFTQLDMPRLKLFSDSLKGKRRSRLRRCYPALLSCAHECIDVLFARFVELVPHPSIDDHAFDAQEFGRFMELSLAAMDTVPPFISDIARFERHLYTCTSGHRWQRGGSNDVAATKGDDTQTMEWTVFPHIHPEAYVLEFRYNVELIVELLSKRAPIDEVVSVPSLQYVLFLPTTTSHPGRALSINESTRRLLALCNGDRTVSEITQAAEDVFGVHSLGDVVQDTLSRLGSLGVIYVTTRLGQEAK